MKKLLVILLLFFPVHGAWAEIISLNCNSRDGTSPMFFEIDTSEKTVKNIQGSYFSEDLIVTDNLFEFEADKDYLYVLSIDNPEIWFHSWHILINRKTGVASFTLVSSNPRNGPRETLHQTLDCEKISGKKKF